MNKQYGDGLRRVLARVGLSQTDIAATLGVTRQTVNNWISADMNRRKMPTEERQRELEGLLGVSTMDIIRAGQPATNGAASEPYARPASAAKAVSDNARHALSRRLREHDPGLLRFVQAVVSCPGFPDMTFDYADSNLVVAMHTRVHRLDRVYDALWKLFKARTLTEAMGITRRHVLALVDVEGGEEYRAEAELAGVELVAFETAEQLADWIVAQH